MVNPVIVELTRARLVESCHRGAVAVATPLGEMVLAVGDVHRPVYPRSAIKAFQCIPLLETGAADRFGFGAAELALACASHSGSERHVAVAAGMLAKANLGAEALACGAHDPLDPRSARDLVRRDGVPSALHNNCSGKHAGMLATAVHLREPVAGYWRPRHAVQQRIRAVLEEFTGVDLTSSEPGIDGCSAPNWAVPLAGLARAFARFGSLDVEAPARRAAVARILNACWAEPELVAGVGRLDTTLLRRFAGSLFVKTGAEGVYCGAFPALKLGFALKVDDGAKRASEAAVSALIARFLPGASDLAEPVVLRNWSGREVGELRCSGDFAAALQAVSGG
jgi:L-asparaginase II